MKGQRHILENILLPILLVLSHVVEQGFLIPQHVVCFVMVVDYVWDFHRTEKTFLLSVWQFLVEECAVVLVEYVEDFVGLGE